MPKRPYPRWQFRHEAVLRWMLENPGSKVSECAAATGYTPTQVSRIRNSPDFQEHYSAARKEIEQKIIARKIGQLFGDDRRSGEA